MKGIYGGTQRLFEQVKRHSAGHTFTYIDLNDTALLKRTIETQASHLRESAADAHPQLMVWIESPTNPLLRLVDLEKVISTVRSCEGQCGRILVVVDNTFATAFNQRPLEFGADIVMISASKYIGGHSDLTGGGLVVRDTMLADRLRLIAKAVGAIASPFDSYTALRGMKTLAVRMQRQSENASRIAEFLQGHPKVAEIHYPGLQGHPQFDLCKRQMRTPGAVVTVRLARPSGDASERRGNVDDQEIDAVKSFLGALRLFVLAESLGGVESMINHCATMSHGGMTKAERAEVGIFDNTLRISCGIELVEELLEDLQRGLDAI
eukprot:TRINITY_DN24529_c0_g1_i6.p1 TRINITY_DN24529_c0_g1~~TRINITY_DN24529_c0_g1_i6.p1  ORF type:complete len:322 (+),score=65.38 TRINITY_DN24529_c0_g1_i6:429-1394(+)